jgi:hypothetical protein
MARAPTIYTLTLEQEEQLNMAMGYAPGMQLDRFNSVVENTNDMVYSMMLQDNVEVLRRLTVWFRQAWPHLKTGDEIYFPSTDCHVGHYYFFWDEDDGLITAKYSDEKAYVPERWSAWVTHVPAWSPGLCYKLDLQLVRECLELGNYLWSPNHLLIRCGTKQYSIFFDEFEVNDFDEFKQRLFEQPALYVEGNEICLS